MAIYGLTGGIASGKTAASNYFARLGAHVIDTDVIAREVTADNHPTLDYIREEFGHSFFTATGSLDRAKVKRLIFTDSALKAQYEKIIHPAIRRQTLESIKKAPDNAPYIIVVVPLLFETGFDSYTGKNIVVDLPVKKQISRAIQRKPSDAPIIRNIIDHQLDRAERARRADYILDNSGSLQELYQQIDSLHALFISKN